MTVKEPLPIPVCVICGVPIPDYVPVYCCNGTDCACQGMPVEPPWCVECWDKIIGPSCPCGTRLHLVRPGKWQCPECE